MASPKMIGFQKTYISNRRADSKKAKAWKRNREYTDRHEEVMAEKREERFIRECEERKRRNELLEV